MVYDFVVAIGCYSTDHGGKQNEGGGRNEEEGDEWEEEEGRLWLSVVKTEELVWFEAVPNQKKRLVVVKTEWKVGEGSDVNLYYIVRSPAIGD